MASSRLGGSLQAAGGIGGLLAVSDADDPNDANDPAGDFAYTYDGNGNVGQLVAWEPGYGGTWGPLWDTTPPTNVRLAARYEYDPYGNLIGPDTDADGDFDGDDDPGPYAGENPFRFSTKYWDDETGLGYWGKRYRDGERWISRDPIGELGGSNVYVYVRNDAVRRFDPLGLACRVQYTCYLVGSSLSEDNCSRDCNYACVETSRTTRAHGADSCDSLVEQGELPPPGRSAVTEATTHTSLFCEYCGDDWGEPAECEEQIKTARHYFTSSAPPPQRNCSRSTCRDACRRATNQNGCEGLKGVAEEACELALIASEAICVSYCNAICRNP